MSHSGNTAKEQLFELVERAELCYRVAEGEKSRLAVELMGTIYRMLDNSELLDEYSDWVLERRDD